MKTLRFNQHLLFNQEWSVYVNFLVKTIKQLGADKLNLVPLLVLLENICAQADEALELIRKSEYTRLCDEADEKRDRIIAAVYNLVRSFLYDEDADMRDAANMLMVVLDHYRGMANEGRDQQSGRVYDFVQELRDNHAERLSKLEGLERRINQLSDANDAYIRLQDDRTYSAAEKTQLRMVVIRREGNRIIRAVWDMTDIMLLTASTPDVEKFAAQLNVANQNERTRIAARQGKKKVKNEQDE